MSHPMPNSGSLPYQGVGWVVPAVSAAGFTHAPTGSGVGGAGGSLYCRRGGQSHFRGRNGRTIRQFAFCAAKIGTVPGERSPQPRAYPARQRAYSMIEVLGAIAVLTSLVAAWLPVQHTARKLHRASRHRQVAMFEAAGALERLAAWPAAELTPERTATIELSEAGKDVLPEAELHVAVQPADDPQPPALRVAVRVTWRESADDEQPRQVELVTWRYAPPDGAQP